MTNKPPLSVTMPTLEFVLEKGGDLSTLEKFMYDYSPRGDHEARWWRVRLSHLLTEAKKEALQDYRVWVNEQG